VCGYERTGFAGQAANGIEHGRRETCCPRARESAAEHEARLSSHSRERSTPTSDRRGEAGPVRTCRARAAQCNGHVTSRVTRRVRSRTMDAATASVRTSHIPNAVARPSASHSREWPHHSHRRRRVSAWLLPAHKHINCSVLLLLVSGRFALRHARASFLPITFQRSPRPARHRSTHMLSCPRAPPSDTRLWSAAAQHRREQMPGLCLACPRARSSSSGGWGGHGDQDLTGAELMEAGEGRKVPRGAHGAIIRGAG